MLTDNAGALSGKGERSSEIDRLPPSCPQTVRPTKARVHELPRTVSVDAALRKSRLLQGLSHSERMLVANAAQIRFCSAGSVIAEQGSAADRLGLLLTGSAQYFFITPEGAKVNLFWLLPGDVFGGASLLTLPGQFLVSTELTKPSSLLLWDRETIRTLAAQFPRLMENGLSIACDYLVWYLATHLSLVSHSARERLAHVLVSLSRGVGQKQANGISLEITNEQLADTANMTPFTVSRLLREWQRNKALKKSRGHVLIFHPERLFDRTSTLQDNSSL